MLKLNIVPKARKLSDGIQYQKKPFRKNPILHNPGIFILAAFMVTFIAGNIGNMTLVGIGFGLTLVGATLLITKNKRTKSDGRISWIFAAVGIYMIGGMLNSILGVYLFVPLNFIRFIIIAVFVKEVIMPLPVYFFLKKRAERCTEGVIACLNDGSADLGSIDELSYTEVIDCGKSPFCRDDVVIKNENWRNFCAKHGIKENHSVMELYNCSPTNGYEYVYSYEGNRYALNLSDRKKDNYAEKYVKEIPVYIDPENPLNYYSTVLMPSDKLSTTIAFMLIFGVLTSVVFFCILPDFGLFV